MRYRLRIYSPRFVRFARVKDYTCMGVIPRGEWFRMYKPRRVK